MFRANLNRCKSIVNSHVPFDFSFDDVVRFNTMFGVAYVVEVLFVVTLPVLFAFPKQLCHLNCMTGKNHLRLIELPLDGRSSVAIELINTNLFLIKRNTRRFITNSTNIKTP